MKSARRAVLTVLLLPAGAWAQEASAALHEAAPATSFDAEAATRAYLDRMTPEQKARSDAYNDNLLKRCSLPEIKAVMAHEMGHYVLNHIYESIVFFAIVLVVGFAFLGKSFEWALRRSGGAWSVHGIGDVAGLPLLAALLSVYFFLLTPILNTR